MCSTDNLPAGKFFGHYFLSEAVGAKRKRKRFAAVLSVMFGGLGSPTLYEYEPINNDPLTYVCASGEVIVPQSMLFDGATTPRLAWIIKGFSPWDWPRSAAIHDWLFEAHHRGLIDISFERSTEILIEALRTERIPEWKIKLIAFAVSKTGRAMWDGED